MPDLFDIELQRLDGSPDSMSNYRGKVLLIVNVASRCGFTPQYDGLQTLFDRYAPRKFAVLAFPCNQFGAQEPGEAQAIADFCRTQFGVSFPVFAKTDVNGVDAHPVYRILKSAVPGILGTEAIKWNFTKFLVDADGRVVRRYAPTDTPESIDADIQALLAASGN